MAELLPKLSPDFEFSFERQNSLYKWIHPEKRALILDYFEFYYTKLLKYQKNVAKFGGIIMPHREKINS